MPFRFDFNIKNFLFKDFDIENAAGLIAVCLSITIFVVLLELLKTTRMLKKLKSNTLNGLSLFKLAFSSTNERSNLIESREGVREIWRISDLFFHFFELIIGYMLMLMAMTYNAYILIAICVGAGIAYLIFGPIIMKVSGRMAIKRMCIGCQRPPTDSNIDGSSTPIIETVTEDSPTTSGLNENEKADENKTRTSCHAHYQSDITVQVHV